MLSLKTEIHISPYCFPLVAGLVGFVLFLIPVLGPLVLLPITGLFHLYEYLFTELFSIMQPNYEMGFMWILVQDIATYFFFFLFFVSYGFLMVIWKLLIDKGLGTDLGFVGTYVTSATIVAILSGLIEFIKVGSF